MIITNQQLKERYNNYIDINGKISRDVKSGKLIPLVRGMYETDPDTEGVNLAQFIYGPSYISFDYALSEYGLIPEAVYTFTCASFNKRKTKMHKNKFGNYWYRDVPKEVFSLGIIVKQNGNYAYQIATPEKALCDKLYSVSPVNSLKELKTLLFEDLRIYEEGFNNLNKEDLLKLAPLYRSKNLQLLEKLLKGDK